MNYSKLSFFIILTLGSYIIYRNKKFEASLIEYVQQQYANDWQILSIRAKEFGNTEKWAKILTIDALKNGKLDAIQDNCVQQTFLSMKRNNQRLIWLIVVQTIVVFYTAYFA
ncbi:hypothetical protein [Shewanella sp.]|uniref:hypothetical protein n=1 Tax=Shewanella sp. TaxID=50422 RepID=UPI003A97EB5E